MISLIVCTMLSAGALLIAQGETRVTQQDYDATIPKITIYMKNINTIISNMDSGDTAVDHNQIIKDVEELKECLGVQFEYHSGKRSEVVEMQKTLFGLEKRLYEHKR